MVLNGIPLALFCKGVNLIVLVSIDLSRQLYGTGLNKSYTVGMCPER